MISRRVLYRFQGTERRFLARMGSCRKARGSWSGTTRRSFSSMCSTIEWLVVFRQDHALRHGLEPVSSESACRIHAYVLRKPCTTVSDYCCLAVRSEFLESVDEAQSRIVAYEPATLEDLNTSSQLRQTESHQILDRCSEAFASNSCQDW